MMIVLAWRDHGGDIYLRRDMESGTEDKKSSQLHSGACVCLLAHRCNSNVCEHADVLTGTGGMCTHSYTYKYAHMFWHIHAWAYIHKYTWIHTQRNTNICMDPQLKNKGKKTFLIILMNKGVLSASHLLSALLGRHGQVSHSSSQSTTDWTLLKPTTMPKILWLSYWFIFSSTN